LSETSETPKLRATDLDGVAGPEPDAAGDAPETADPTVVEAGSTGGEPQPAAAPVTPPEPAPGATVSETPPAAAVVAEISGPNQPPASAELAPAAPAEPPAAETGAPMSAEPSATPAESPSSASTGTASAEPPDAKAETEPEAPTKPVLLCATVGPFQSRDAQRAAERRLTARVERIDGRSQNSREAKMFTVFLEPTDTEAEAEKRLDELKSKGITDYFLIRRGEMRNAIQVGTFRSQESVTKRLAELERSGYKAVVVPKSETGAEKFWLDVVYDKQKETLRSLKTLAGEGARVIRADCPR
jgi:hypothetical protein